MCSQDNSAHFLKNLLQNCTEDPCLATPSNDNAVTRTIPFHDKAYFEHTHKLGFPQTFAYTISNSRRPLRFYSGLWTANFFKT